MRYKPGPPDLTTGEVLVQPKENDGLTREQWVFWQLVLGAVVRENAAVLGLYGKTINTKTLSAVQVIAERAVYAISTSDLFIGFDVPTKENLVISTRAHNNTVIVSVASKVDKIGIEVRL